MEINQLAERTIRLRSSHRSIQRRSRFGKRTVSNYLNHRYFLDAPYKSPTPLYNSMPIHTMLILQERERERERERSNEIFTYMEVMYNHIPLFPCKINFHQQYFN